MKTELLRVFSDVFTQIIPANQFWDSIHFAVFFFDGVYKTGYISCIRVPLKFELASSIKRTTWQSQVVAKELKHFRLTV